MRSHNPGGMMDRTRPTLLLTRPAAASARFARDFAARFGAEWPVVIAPLMETVFLSPPLSAGPFAGVILTSETAVGAYARLTDDRSPPAWCVGPRTAAAAQAAGFQARQGPGDAAGLARLLAAERHGVWLWPRGRDVATDLTGVGPAIQPLIVYEQRPSDLPPPALALLAGAAPVILPLFSPRSARLFAATGPHRAPLMVAALSQAVAAALPQGVSALEIADRPDADGMSQALARLISRHAVETGETRD